MSPKFLLDTQIVVWWLSDPRKLSREQTRVLDAAVQRAQPVGVSPITLLEIAVLCGNRGRIKRNADEFFDQLEANPVFRILPLTFEIASEVASLGAQLRDPADRAIVATARVHHLQLLTSDQAIIQSQLVPVVE